MIFDTYLFYVKVPPEWKLSVEKVYIYCEIPKPSFKEMRRYLGAFDYTVCRHMQEAHLFIVGEAPEFKLNVNNLSEFVAQQTALNRDEAKIFKKHCLVDIHEFSDTEWRQGSFFFNYNDDPSKATKIEWLKTICKARNIPIFARGGLYNWALLSVVDLLDENNNIKDKKAFKIEDAWSGWLKVDSNDIDKMNRLAENSPDALKIVNDAKIRNGVPIYSRFIELARRGRSEEHKHLLTPKEKVQSYAANKYLAQMESQLQKAEQEEKVKQIGEITRPAFSQNSIYDCYQRVNIAPLFPTDKTTFEFTTGPIFVGSSFSDRTILLHP